ncbi:MAG: ferritin-like domain-containing protein [Acidobacteria bacterium]|nr:ferritin-like domain-containing protein [Acidobacteriota bacterium]
MTFETKRDVLNWYEAQPASLTAEFRSTIDWTSVRKYPFDKRFVPVLFYMRDVESLTDMYYRELKRTPTGRDPDIRKFMARWGEEEMVHGEILDRFLNELGYETSKTWHEGVRSSVSRFYKAHAYAITTLTNLIGTKFTATHMVFGAINEMTTGQAYRALMKKADHPILTKLLRAILREESLHTNFYASVARLELKRHPMSRKLARFVIDHFWEPVGGGALGRERSDYAIAQLFGDEEGRRSIDASVTQRLAGFPGFAGITTINETAEKCIRTGRLVDMNARYAAA